MRYELWSRNGQDIVKDTVTGKTLCTAEAVNLLNERTNAPYKAHQETQAAYDKCEEERDAALAQAERRFDCHGQHCRGCITCLNEELAAERERREKAEVTISQREAADAKLRAKWRSDPLHSKIDGLMSRIVGMQPNECVVLADLVDRLDAAEENAR